MSFVKKSKILIILPFCFVSLFLTGCSKKSKILKNTCFISEDIKSCSQESETINFLHEELAHGLKNSNLYSSMFLDHEEFDSIKIDLDGKLLCSSNVHNQINNLKTKNSNIRFIVVSKLFTVEFDSKKVLVLNIKIFDIHKLDNILVICDQLKKFDLSEHAYNKYECYKLSRLIFEIIVNTVETSTSRYIHSFEDGNDF